MRYCIPLALGLVALPALGNDFSVLGPYAVGQRTVQITRTDSSLFDAQLFYPALTAGIDAPIAPPGDLFPAVSFGHGFVQPVFQYQSTLESLASWGYLAIATESQVTVFPDKPQYAQDMIDTLTYLEIQNADPGSDLFGRVDTNAFGMSGHSLGAGISIVAASMDSRVKAVANLAAASTNAPPPFPPGLPPTSDPSAIALIADVRVPVSLIAGSSDGIVAVATNGQLMYDNANAPRQLPNIQGGYHVGFVDNDVPIFSDTGLISRETQLAITRDELITFFNFYLKQDESLWRDLWGPERFSNPAVVTQADPGMTLTPLAPSQPASAGQLVTFSVTLTNTTDQANQLDLFVDDNAWTTLLSVPQTPTLAPGESFTFTVDVEVPTLLAGLSDTALVSARSGLDGLTRGYTRITTAVPEARSLILAALPVAGTLMQLARRRGRAAIETLVAR